jgi:D-alanine-D-alanine ligase
VRVMVIFGGRSGEHDVSLASARAITDALEKSGRYEVVPVGITREGRWVSSGDPMRELQSMSKALTSSDGSEPPASNSPAPISEKLPANLGSVDVVFPVLHGPYGEDGTVQGLLECLRVPYVGAGVLACAVCMDKVVFKDLMAHAGLPQVGYAAVDGARWQAEPEAVLGELKPLGWPVFVKPVALGSSVGISRAGDEAGLRVALDEALAHDSRAIVEAASGGLELECSVIGNRDPLASVPGEIVVEGDWYDFEAKYTPGGMDLVVPARVPEEIRERVRELAVQAFLRSGCRGLARVDFFVEGDRVLVNELNTMPGFTQTSVFGKLFAASGVEYEELLERLLGYALEHNEAESELRH